MEALTGCLAGLGDSTSGVRTTRRWYVRPRTSQCHRVPVHRGSIEMRRRPCPPDKTESAHDLKMCPDPISPTFTVSHFLPHAGAQSPDPVLTTVKPQRLVVSTYAYPPRR